MRFVAALAVLGLAAVLVAMALQRLVDVIEIWLEGRH